jgi:hypothetical protein
VHGLTETCPVLQSNAARARESICIICIICIRCTMVVTGVAFIKCHRSRDKHTKMLQQDQACRKQMQQDLGVPTKIRQNLIGIQYRFLGAGQRLECGSDHLVVITSA